MPDGHPSENEETTNPPGDALELIDQAVARISDAEVDGHLRKVLSQATPDVMATARHAPRVFISYTHDDAQHAEAVRAFSEFLVADCGLDVHMDRWDLVARWEPDVRDMRRGWYGWAIDQITRADFILVIASPLYTLVSDGLLGESHRGIQSELPLIRELLHSDQAAWQAKVLPVALPRRSAAEIPEFLQRQATESYQVTELTMTGTEDLLRAITRQPAYHRAARRTRRALPSRSARDPASPGVLTPTELQIVALIAGGHSNDAIAGELLITRATATRHVASILAKLGFTSRLQIAAWAADQRIDVGQSPTSRQH